MVLKTIIEDRPAGHVVSEASYARSREQITLAATAVALPSGTALGKLDANGHYVPYDPDGIDGSEDFGGFLYERRDIAAGTQRAVVHARDCEINGREVTFINALDAGELAAFEAKAAAQGVLVRY